MDTTDTLAPRSLKGIANYLRSEYWEPRQFELGPTKEIAYGFVSMSEAAQNLARLAMDTWSDITGINFVESNTAPQIFFDDAEDGAFSGSIVEEGVITASLVNIGPDWLETYGTNIDSYSFQTFIHEIGHALGLGHPGPYNETADFPNDLAFANDSWQTSIMSYILQEENTYTNATNGYLLTPMPADVIAMQDMYGMAQETRLEDTTYGFNDTTGLARLDFINTDFFVALTLVDSGGEDTLDLSGYDVYQKINLNDLTYSSIGGGRGNLSIGNGTVIENAIGGSGKDRIIGNEASNTLTGGLGADTFIFRGDDIGTDTITDFELGTDRLIFKRGLEQDDFVLEQTDDGLLLSADAGSILLANVSQDNTSDWLV